VSGSFTLTSPIASAEWDAFHRLDRLTAKRPDLWVFVCDPLTHALPAGSRALLEAVRHDSEITKVVLGEGPRPDLGVARLAYESAYNESARDFLLHAGRVFLPHSAHAAAVPWPIGSEGRLVVAVRDGLQLNRGAVGQYGAVDVGAVTNVVHAIPDQTINAVLTASRIDALCALATTWPCTYNQVWNTGLPAHDFLFRALEDLPDDIRRQHDEVHTSLAGKDLLLLLPHTTGPEAVSGVFLSTPQLASLAAWCEGRDIVLGLRMDTRGARPDRPAPQGVLDLSPARFPSLHAVLRAADLVLTDHADAALDFALLGRPVVSLVQHPAEAPRDMLLDLERLFPGPVVRKFESVFQALDSARNATLHPRYDAVRALLCDYRDDHNSARVVERIRAMTKEAGA